MELTQNYYFVTDGNTQVLYARQGDVLNEEQEARIERLYLRGRVVSEQHRRQSQLERITETTK